MLFYNVGHLHECLIYKRVEFILTGGDLLSTNAAAVKRNPVLNMVYQRSLLSESVKPIVIDDDRRTFQTLLQHLDGEPVDLSNRDLTDMIPLFRCSHKYQCYDLASHVLRELDSHCSADTVLHLYMVLQPLPELPSHIDPSGPSAPPESDLQESDPEQAEFASLLLHCFQHCLQVIDNNSNEVLASDALLSLAPDQAYELAQRDSLQARELDIGRALLRWMRHYALSYRLEEERKKHLLLGTLRLLRMPARDVKKLELDRCGLLTREELEAVLRHLHHGDAVLPESLEPYREYWLCRRNGCTRNRGILQRLVERTRGVSLQDETDSAERREAAHQRRSRRADKLKMALATGASLIFD